MKPLRIALVALSLTVVSCSGNATDQKDDGQPTDDKPAVTQQSLEDSKCLGNQVPPTNYMQETAFVPNDRHNATQVAGEVATERLIQRVCQGYRCNAIAPHVTVWNTESDVMQACAMAVVKKDNVQKFKDAPRLVLNADLEARAAALLNALGKRQKKGEPRIAIDNVRDVGVDGGPRAEWLIDRMNAALSKNGALIARIPPDWSGLGLPAHADAVLRGRITRMHGQESMLEVTWNLDVGKGIKAVDPIAFPELIGPAVDLATHMPDLAGINPAISLRFDARPGGGMCNGQTTELRLESSKELHVRVVNLFGEGDQGMVIFAPDDEIPARETIPAGEFEVVKATDVPVERFLVLGSETKQGLGALASVNAPCRLPADMAKQLSNNRGIPAGAKKYTTSRGYRILEGEECRAYQPKSMPTGWFETVPECF